MWALIFALVLLIPAAVSAQTPADAVADVVLNSGSFPLGTTVFSVTVDGESAVVDLSAEAAPADLGDEQADIMGKAIMDALDQFGVKALEVTVGGYALWEYLPRSIAPDGSGGGIGVQSLDARTGRPSATGGGQIGIASIGGGGGQGSGVPALTGELAGKGVGLYNSHGAYWDERTIYRYWRPSQRTFCGPNMAAPRPPGWSGSVYQPSNNYYYTRGFQWGSYYEDWRTDQEIRFLRAYLESSGATVLCGRNLDKNAGNFDYNAYGYPNCNFPLPRWITAAKYHLQEIGAPAGVWNEPALTAETDKDIRARPYWTNYHMVEPVFGAKKWPLTSAEIQTVRYRPDVWENWVSIHLHTNAAGSGQGKGTETYWYTSTYPWLQTKATALAGAVNTGVVNAIRTKYDGYWAENTAMYGYTGANPTEWPTGVGNWTGYAQTSPSSKQWANRGVKTSNFGEIREALVPAVLMEMLFHDDWKFYPDHVFSVDQIFQSTAAWGMYEGICSYWGIAPKPRMAASVDNVSFPAFVLPNTAISGTVTMQNEGQAWCWGDKWVTMVYAPYTVWKLQATANDQFVPGTKMAIADGDPIYPGQTETFDVSLTAPATTGYYTTEWQMLKDDAFGGSFGAAASAQIGVDGDAPVITIAAPEAKWYNGDPVTVSFSATDAMSGVAGIAADVDGAAVNSGDSVPGLATGAHTLTVAATDNVGNVATASVTFDVDRTLPEVTITSPEAKAYAYGCVSFSFGATDVGSGLAGVAADVDGVPVANGQTVCWLGLGTHTLTVVATDNVGNVTTQQVAFMLVNTAGKVTVGGWIELENKKGTCGFNCDYVAGAAAPTGHLTYQDHDTGMTVQSVNMVAMGIVGNQAWFYGACTIEGEAGHWFRVDVTDNGEPGCNDVFNIQLDTGYSKGGKLGGGNVTIH